MLLTLGWAACAFAEPADPGPGRPNVLVLLADDQGFGDLSLNGNKDLATPHIDSLGHDGVRFDRFYVCAVCAPTRAEFLTGRYHPRTGVHGVSEGAERMNLDEHTLAEAFQSAGYATGCFGKWHNGMQYPYHPRARGFDTFVGFCSGHWGDYFDAELERDGDSFPSKGYIADVFTDEAIRFIDASAKQHTPFFCYVAFCTPHSPMQVPDKHWDRHKDKPLLMDHSDKGNHTRAALAIVENLDDNVARLLSTLDELGLVDDTIVVFFSDNGPNGKRWNQGMRGIKGSVDEGGLRSPLLVRWPGEIGAGGRYPWIAGAVDLAPTLAGLAGIDLSGDKPLDGLDLSAVLKGTASAPSDSPRLIFSSQNRQVSARTDRYRIDDTGRLYDMENDPGQTTDISARQPETTQRLKEAVADWREEVGVDRKREPRPFVVGHADWPVTELPARDATSRGTIKRSSPHPNCSYYRDWTSLDDRIEWDVDVLTAGRYEALVSYACPAKAIGSTIELRLGDVVATGKVSETNDPPAQGEKENRIFKGESFVKDFKPMSIGVLELPAGRGTLTLRARDIAGAQVMEFRRLLLKRAKQ